MKWSKLKKIAETLLADSLKNRIKYHVTQYGPGDSYTMARGWITLDGKEIANFSSAEWLMQHGNLAGQTQNINQTSDYTNPAQETGYYLAHAEAQEILHGRSIYSRDQFYESLEEYVQLPIDAALSSRKKIIQGLALLDRRFGTRRLKAVELPELATIFIATCYHIRSTAESHQALE
jgi:hypothetical protein